jgi:hypothetical protein
VSERMGERGRRAGRSASFFSDMGCEVASSGDEESARCARPHHAAAHA